MAKKYKVLKVMKVGSIIVGPGAATRENEEFAKVNAELVEIYDTNKNDVISAAKDADVILLGSVPVARWIIEAAPKCIAVMCQSVGYDLIDVKAATENNILVVNNPSFEWCIEEVSNHAITLLLDCAKKVMMLDAMVRQGRWAEAKKAQPWMGSMDKRWESSAAAPLAEWLPGKHRSLA
jgi:lactate dehydrogenase-like 2-hydroxyacid dehydrogenase